VENLLNFGNRLAWANFEKIYLPFIQHPYVRGLIQTFAEIVHFLYAFGEQFLKKLYNHIIYDHLDMEFCKGGQVDTSTECGEFHMEIGQQAEETYGKAVPKQYDSVVSKVNIYKDPKIPIEFFADIDGNYRVEFINWLKKHKNSIDIVGSYFTETEFVLRTISNAPVDSSSLPVPTQIQFVKPILSIAENIPVQFLREFIDLEEFIDLSQYKSIL
jgi:hypothetical protein